jgi:hypothetical protein
MDDTQREPRVTESSDRSEDDRGQEAATAIVARLLANPRRVRRD